MLWVQVWEVLKEWIKNIKYLYKAYDQYHIPLVLQDPSENVFWAGFCKKRV